MGKKKLQARAEEYRLLDVGVDPPGLCDDAELQGSQDAHFWRAARWADRRVSKWECVHKCRWFLVLSRLGPAKRHWIAACGVVVREDAGCTMACVQSNKPPP
jgi:hypothetical protein